MGCVPWDCPWLLSCDACPHFPALGALGTFPWFGSTVPRDLPQSCLVPSLGSIWMFPARGVCSPPVPAWRGAGGAGYQQGRSSFHRGPREAGGGTARGVELPGTRLSPLSTLTAPVAPPHHPCWPRSRGRHAFLATKGGGEPPPRLPVPRGLILLPPRPPPALAQHLY